MGEAAGSDKYTCHVFDLSANPTESSPKRVGSLNFSFLQWYLGGLISSHADPDSFSFISERLLSELFLGPLRSSTSPNLSPAEVTAALEKAFEATEVNCKRALQLYSDELAALRCQLEQIESEPVQPSAMPANQQRFFLQGRIEACKTIINRLSDCVTTCVLLIHNEADIYIANLGDYFAFIVSADDNASGYRTRPICTPHDVLNVGEHERLHAMNIPSAEMNEFFGDISGHNGLPKFVRCFAGGVKKRLGSPLIAAPTIVGPLNLDHGSGCIVIYNSTLHNNIEHNLEGSSSVADLIASKLFPLTRLNPVDRQANIQTAIEALAKRINSPAKQQNAIFVRWFGGKTQTPASPPMMMMPLTIDVEGSNGYDFGRVPPPGAIVTVENVPVLSDRIDSSSRVQTIVSPPERPRRPKTPLSADFVSTYVTLVQANISAANSEQHVIDRAFEENARGRLSVEELKILGL